jgi:hypothetical protein
MLALCAGMPQHAVNLAGFVPAVALCLAWESGSVFHSKHGPWRERQAALGRKGGGVWCGVDASGMRFRGLPASGTHQRRRLLRVLGRER